MTKQVVAVGPELPNFGSWTWIGEDLLRGLQPEFSAIPFSDPEHPPEADITVFLKFKPTLARLAHLKRQTRLVFMPVDIYGSIQEIEQDRDSLLLFNQIVVHCRRLVRYFAGVTATDYIDHSLKYAVPPPVQRPSGGPLLWVGRRCNLQPVVAWCNRFAIGNQVSVLTNLEDKRLSPTSLGFGARCQVLLEQWTPERHITATTSAFAALDVKGIGFRERHKPPAKVLDYAASGLPVVINSGGSADLHLQSLGHTAIRAESGFPNADAINDEQSLRFSELLWETLSFEVVSANLKEILS